MSANRRVFVIAGLVGLMVVWLGGIALAQDVGDPIQSGVPLTEPLEERVLRNEAAMNLAWLVVGAMLVIFMQAGFTMVEVGFARAKHASHVAMQNFTIFGVAMVAYFAVGYGLQFAAVAVPLIGFNEPIGELWPSADFGLFGTSGFFLTNAYLPPILAFFLFQAAFMDTAATIPTGAMAERWKFSSFIGWGVFCGALYFPLYGAWVWGGGWLSQLGSNLGFGNGVVDFAGSGVVHGMGGMAALTGAYLLGPRAGKFGPNGKPRTLFGHNMPMSLLGTFILLFGWFGFNAASTFAASDTRFAVVAFNTALAAAVGSVAALATSYLLSGKPDPSYVANGMLGGLVAVTGPCAFIAPWAAFVIGASAGVIVIFSMRTVEHILRIDDPAGAISVHGVCGLFGVIAVGIFADGTYGAGYNGVDSAVTGILYGPEGTGQLVAQLIACLVIVCFGGGLSYLFFRFQNAISPIRSRAEDERTGLDVEEIGVLGYADFPLLVDADFPEGIPDLDSARRAAVPSEPEPMPYSTWDWRR